MATIPPLRRRHSYRRPSLQPALARLRAASIDRRLVAVVAYTSRPRITAAAGFYDRELFDLLLEPGYRSPLYRSSHLADRFALGLATGQEWSHFYYLNGGAEIALVKVLDWLAGDPELLALSHAMLVQQCQLGLGLSCGHLRGPRTGRDHRPRPGGVQPHDIDAPEAARPAHA